MKAVLLCMKWDVSEVIDLIFECCCCLSECGHISSTLSLWCIIGLDIVAVLVRTARDPWIRWFTLRFAAFNNNHSLHLSFICSCWMADLSWCSFHHIILVVMPPWWQDAYHNCKEVYYQQQLRWLIQHLTTTNLFANHVHHLLHHVRKIAKHSSK